MKKTLLTLVSALALAAQTATAPKPVQSHKTLEYTMSPEEAKEQAAKSGNPVFSPASAPKLNAEEIQALNQSATAAQVADLQKQVAELRQQIVILRACWTRGIAEKDCQFQADGTLKAAAAKGESK